MLGAQIIYGLQMNVTSAVFITTASMLVLRLNHAEQYEQEKGSLLIQSVKVPQEYGALNFAVQ